MSKTLKKEIEKMITQNKRMGEQFRRLCKTKKPKLQSWRRQLSDYANGGTLEAERGRRRSLICSFLSKHISPYDSV